MDALTELQKKLNYQFKDLSLLHTAMTHRSVGKETNERLEFLGDSVLSFIITSELYRRYPDLQEGALSRLRASLVNGEMLALLARELQINSSLRLGFAEFKSGGQERLSILSDALEAIMGAIYLDGGIEACSRCVLKWFERSLNECSDLTVAKDAKSALQEWTQAKRLELPHYKITAILGAAHNQTFQVSCHIEGLDYKSQGEGSNRRSAEQQAAERYLEHLLIKPDA